ncbi:polysaccharide deacetylase family protein [Nannocystaceae bacterium ST9]
MQCSAFGRRFRGVLALALILIAPGCAGPEIAARSHESERVEILEFALAEPPTIENPDLALELGSVEIADEAAACLGPEPSARWAQRGSDDEWARGLYPARERYPEGWLALTFDDGPHPTRTRVVLDELARHGQHATFFLTGHAIKASTYPLVQRMVAEGHTLANHGHRHDTDMAEQVDTIAELEAYLESELELTQIRVDLAMLATSADDFRAIDERVFAGLRWTDERAEQLAAMPELRVRHRALLDERGFGEGTRPLALAWVRPPGGNPYVGKRWTNDEREAFARVVNRMNLRVVMWNHGSGDSDPALAPEERMDPTRVAETARKAGRRGGVYVAHDRIAPEAARALLDAVAKSDAVVVDLADLHAAKAEAAGWCD